VIRILNCFFSSLKQDNTYNSNSVVIFFLFGKYNKMDTSNQDLDTSEIIAETDVKNLWKEFDDNNIYQVKILHFNKYIYI
jgi:hypothetical protein